MIIWALTKEWNAGSIPNEKNFRADGFTTIITFYKVENGNRENRPAHSKVTPYPVHLSNCIFHQFR